ncbi:MAG: hypothetical protein ABIT07_12695 [Ferruginibacter sp.]
MKLNMQNFTFKGLYLFLALLFINIAVFAQDSTVSSTTTTTAQSTTEKIWYTEPWAWIVGGIILILIIVAVTRSGSSSSSTDRVTVTKTVDRDTDV